MFTMHKILRKALRYVLEYSCSIHAFKNINNPAKKYAACVHHLLPVVVYQGFASDGVWLNEKPISNLNAVEVFWTPSDPSTVMTNRNVIPDFPEFIDWESPAACLSSYGQMLFTPRLTRHLRLESTRRKCCNSFRYDFW